MILYYGLSCSAVSNVVEISSTVASCDINDVFMIELAGWYYYQKYVSISVYVAWYVPNIWRDSNAEKDKLPREESFLLNCKIYCLHYISLSQTVW